jgi:hypothetical protein
MKESPKHTTSEGPAHKAVPRGTTPRTRTEEESTRFRDEAVVNTAVIIRSEIAKMLRDATSQVRTD